jgi:hypothetical protein
MKILIIDKDQIIGSIILCAMISLIWLVVTFYLKWFEATSSQVKETITAQVTLENQVVAILNDYPRVDVRHDYSAYVYINKNNYMRIPYPDRKATNESIANAWCKDKAVPTYFFPEVQIRDIRTGDTLASKSCVF